MENVSLYAWQGSWIYLKHNRSHVKTLIILPFNKSLQTRWTTLRNPYSMNMLLVRRCTHLSYHQGKIQQGILVILLDKYYGFHYIVNHFRTHNSGNRRVNSLDTICMHLVWQYSLSAHSLLSWKALRWSNCDTKLNRKKYIPNLVIERIDLLMLQHIFLTNHIILPKLYPSLRTVV